MDVNPTSLPHARFSPQPLGAPPPPPRPAGPPAVWSWYVAYAIALAVVYAGCFLGSIALVVIGVGTDGRDAGEMIFTGAFLAVFCLPLLIATAAAPFLPKAPWAWIYHLVLIGLGMTSACCLPVCIPLLMHWMKPETKAFFGRT